ncbi:MAG: hypothetical protein JRI25_06770 [Deltaproteobacteria bacterium]|nr:hypothetical protein [Deltaproteobacteria bacterium]
MPPAASALLALLDDEDKYLRKIVTRGLVKADIEALEPTGRTLLTDRKKANREPGARLLQPLPHPKARASIAQAFLATEKTASVRALLEPIAQEAPWPGVRVHRWANVVPCAARVLVRRPAGPDLRGYPKNRGQSSRLTGPGGTLLALLLLCLALARSRLAAGGGLLGGLPKVEAMIEFVEAGGGQAALTDPANLVPGLAGETGTRIVPDPE